MLRSHNQQDVELDFFTSFLDHAIKGETAYIDIVKPIILDAASLSRKEMKVTDLDRKGLNIKLMLFVNGSTNLAGVNIENLSQKLPMILELINESRKTTMA
jgi:hypothetical protein